MLGALRCGHRGQWKYLSYNQLTDKGRGVGLHGPRYFSSLFDPEGVLSVCAALAPDSRSSFLRFLLRLLLRRPNRHSLERNHIRLIHHSIQQGHRHRWIAQVIGPIIEAHIGDDGCRVATVASIDDFVKQAQGIGYLLPLHPLEAEFINDQ
jgi:hypothetical protein